MKTLRTKTVATILIALLMVSMPLFVVGAAPKKDYNTITAGEVFYSAGHYLEGTAIPTGFDEFGYNYQGHMFKGSYYNSYAGGAGFPAWTGDDEDYLAENPDAEDHRAWPYREVKLAMKWNDAWLSNMDREDPDLKLDRHYGHTSYIGSGAWLTNHQSGSYEDNGEVFKWNYFVKIVAAPAQFGSNLQEQLSEFNNVSIVYINTAWGDKAFMALSGSCNVIDPRRYPPGGLSISPYLRYMPKVDAIILISGAEAAFFADELQEYDTPIYCLVGSNYLARIN